MEKNNSLACKICSKLFSSGKAIGGHMRSHFAKLPILPNPETNNQELDNSSQLIHLPTQPVSSLTSHSQKIVPAENIRYLKHNFFSLENSNRENESWFYPKYPTNKRSKCHRKMNATAERNDETQVSPILDSFPVEEVARTLLLLSNDKWPERKEKTNKPKMKETNEMEAKDRENGRDGLLFQTQSQAKFNCKRCGKTFQSYQALGGHSASHKRNENKCQKGCDFSTGGNDKNTTIVDQKLFACPCCSKVFNSARRLGGHRKVHFKTNAQTTTNQLGGTLVVDLNLPALTEDGEAIRMEL
ncbi:hypothetical protein VNO78_26977 [Psophocarpus tetragonolobus]|uniref:C2H2-type domain-containing protein n=1 Tax=Psophocarpus tetragonolobus TaxID=3891 RepID=A0AAN9S1L5_PSOTE